MARWESSRRLTLKCGASTAISAGAGVAGVEVFDQEARVERRQPPAGSAARAAPGVKAIVRQAATAVPGAWLIEHVQHDPGVVAVIASVEQPPGGGRGIGRAQVRVQLVRRRVSAVFLHGVQVGDRRVGDGLPRARGGEVGQAAAGADVIVILPGSGRRRSPEPTPATLASRGMPAAPGRGWPAW